MPNWCATVILVKNNDCGILENLRKEFETAQKCRKYDNGFGDGWLGDVLSYLGYDEKTIVHGPIKCRGMIIDQYIEKNELRIFTDTAWVPMLKPVAMMVEKYAPGSEILYYATEPGCDLFWTNDASQEGKVTVDVFGTLPDELQWLEDDPEMTEKDLFDEIALSLGWPERGKELKEKITEKYNDLFHVHPWEMVPISELQ